MARKKNVRQRILNIVYDKRNGFKSLILMYLYASQRSALTKIDISSK